MYTLDRTLNIPPNMTQYRRSPLRTTIARIAKLPAHSLRHIADSKPCKKQSHESQTPGALTTPFTTQYRAISDTVNAAAGMIRSNSDGSFHTRLRRYISEFCVFVGERSHLRSRMTKLLQFCNHGCSFMHPRFGREHLPARCKEDIRILPESRPSGHLIHTRG